jgi:hypothetical protein
MLPCQHCHASKQTGPEPAPAACVAPLHLHTLVWIPPVSARYLMLWQLM